MGIIIRQSLKSTIISYLGVLIGTFNVLWLFPRYLQPDEIGLLRMLQDIPLLLAVFLQFGAANLAEKFYFHFKSEENKDNGFQFLLIAYPLAGFTLFLISFWTFNDFWKGIYEDKSPLLVNYFIFIVPLALFMMYMSVLEAYTRVNFRIVVPIFIREILIRILFAAITLVYALRLVNFDTMVVLYTGSYLISLIFLIIYIKWLKGLYLKPKWSVLNKKILKEMGAYAIFIIPGTAGSIIASKIDVLMLGSITGLEAIGIYSLAYFIGTVVEMPRRAISMISIPFISQAWKEHDLKTIDTLYKKTALNQLIIGGLLFLLIWCNVDDILSLIPNAHIYKEGKYVILFIGLARLIDMAMGINSEIILYSKYYKFNLVSIIFLSVITVVTCQIFIPLYGINGAALAFAITLLLFNLLKVVFIWKAFKLQPFGKGMGIVSILFLITYLPFGLLFLEEHSIWQALMYITIKSSLITGIIICIIYYFNISEDIKNTIDQIIKKFILKR